MRALIDGGPFIWLLTGLSLTSLTFILERAWSLQRRRVLPRPLQTVLAEGDPARIRTACLAHPSPLAQLVTSVIDHLPWSKEDNVSALEVKARREIAHLERGLVILEIIVGIAPLLGLVGTIQGIIPLLGDFGKNIQADNAFIARGMSIALYKTVLGLLVAMPTLAAWSFFNKQVELLGLDLENACDALLRRHYLKRRKNDSDSTPRS